MTRYVTKNDLSWQKTTVRGGTVIDESIVWEGSFDMRSAFFRMPKGMQIPQHTHPKWVQVIVIEGQMQVETEEDGKRLINPGECYLVEPGDTHIETAIEDTLVLVTQEEDSEKFLRKQ